MIHVVREPIDTNETGLRSIVAIKAFYGVVFFAIGLGILTLIKTDVSDLAEQAAGWMGIDPENDYLLAVLEWLTGVSPKQIAAMGTGTILYAGLYLTMAWGLHLRQVWAEWLTIVATGFFIPLEIYEVLRSLRPTYVLVLVVNASIVWYLLRRRVRASEIAQARDASIAADVIGPPTARS